jgi:hypothetical protein
MNNCTKWSVGVDESVSAQLGYSLISALTTIFPVKFSPCRNGQYDGLDALIVSATDSGTIVRLAGSGLPVFAVPAHASQQTEAARTFHLLESPALDAALRGYQFDEGEALPITPLPIEEGDQVLAAQGGRPIWLQRRVADVDVTAVAWPLPHFNRGEHICEHFRAGRFIRLLPLLQFFRDLTREAEWDLPPTPACLVVDDPSLYSGTYGHLDFGQLAVAAREQGFHASVAMVPLDAWWVNRQVAKIFRKNALHLSILIHGNNHTRDELAKPASDTENLALLAQALRRWQRVERLPGIEVCRIMECPHGGLSMAMLEPMARLGYEAAFATPAHLLRCNPMTTFPISLGAERTSVGRRTVPLVPRIRAEAGWQTEVRLAAFLRRPVILATHHWDFAEDRHVSEDFAGIINRLPNMRWSSPTAVARAAYQSREDAETLHLQLGSRLVDAPVTNGSRQLLIHRPWLRGATESEVLVVRRQGKELLRISSASDVVGPIPVTKNTALRISSSVANRVDCESVPPPRVRCWPIVRKILVEMRDRTCLRLSPRRQRERVNTLEPEQSAQTCTAAGAH